LAEFDPLPPLAALPLKGGVNASEARPFLPLRGGEPPKAAGGQAGQRSPGGRLRRAAIFDRDPPGGDAPAGTIRRPSS